ncbi:MAG: septum formation initiator family protein [Burkholderiales bacterium]|jgi:cell division protein FtsB
MSYSRGLALVVKARTQVTMREETPRSEPRTRMRAWVLGTVIALIALAVGSVFGDRGILSMVGEREKIEALRGELDALRAENARLSAEITDLRQNPRAIERLAREELGLARPDETVFLIRDASPDDRP